MDSRILTVIPTPPAQRWREVRLLYLPRAMFVLAIALVAWLWSEVVAPASLVAEASVVGTDVRTTKGGVVASVKVALNQTVRTGDVLGYVAAANPRLLDASAAVIRAEVGMLSSSMAGATDQQRVALEFERMAIDWMGRRIDRAALQARLQQNEADLSRAEPLYRSHLISEENYQQLKIAREGLMAQIEEQNKLIARLEPIFRDRATSKADLSGETALAAAIKVQDAKLNLAEEELSPVPLIAPIDGVLSLVLRRPGEAVMAGDTVLRITAPKPDRLAGYLMQPLPFDPKPGMKAQIRTRGLKPKVSATTITHVGAALEPITPGLIAAMRLPTTPLPETALRVEFALPAGFELRPGEHVDIYVP